MSILGDRISAQRKISCVQLAKIPAPDFDLAMTLGSGQVFHWEKLGNGFIGAIGDRPVYVEQCGNLLKARAGARKLDGLKPSSLDAAKDGTREVAAIVANYFALDHPLAEICASFPVDPVMGAAKEFCRGLRIIRQPKWECLATFICSSMKQVAHIRQISRSLRERFGERRKITLERSIENTDGGSAAPRAMVIDSASPTLVNIELATGRVRPVGGQGTARSTQTYAAFTFPSAARIAESSEKELRKCALGYRAKTLLASALLIASGDVDLEKLAALTDLDLRARLCELPGVGSKVANCVMLFAYERLRAFPIDVWIERVLREKYFPRARRLNAARLQAFTEEYFGDHGGYAQQYLFHHARKTARRSRTIGATQSKRRRLSQSRV
jgi:N-glycosylase/DNA lyase